MRRTWDDLRAAVRYLTRRPGSALVLTAVLALFIGAATAAFGLARAVLWRPLPFADAERLMFVWESVERDGTPQHSRVTGARYAMWRDTAATAFSRMSPFGAAEFTLETPSGAISVRGVRVGTNYFETLGIQPQLGRAFVPSDDMSDREPVAILSHAFWMQHFGGRRDAIGQALRLSGRAYTIVGIMPPVLFPGWPVNPARITLDLPSQQLWVPIPRTAALDQSARAHVLGVVARLAPGVSTDQARDILNQSTSANAPDVHGGDLAPLRDQFVRDARTPLITLAGAALAILLIACASLTSVYVSAFEARRAEFAVRAAIGAGVPRLIRQVALEALLPALVGGALGLALAYGALVAVPYWVPDNIPLLTHPALDPAISLFALSLALASAVVIIFWPVRRLVAAAPAPRGVPERPRGTIYRVLVVSQISVAVALVSAAALLARSLYSVSSQDTGFAIENTLVASIGLPSPRPPDPRRVAATERELLSRIGTLRGVRSVAAAYDHPLQANWSEVPTISGDTTARDSREQAELRIVSPGYFEALGVEVLEGRALNERDDLDARGAAVVNEALARRLGGRAVGRRLQSGTPQFMYGNLAPTDFLIVGVVEDERFRGLETSAQPAFYLSTRQFPQTGFSLLVRTSADPRQRIAEVRAAVTRLDRAITFDEPTTLSQILADQLATRRITTGVVESFAAAALVLAMLGLYGLLAILVAGRTREIGVRLALGAPPALVARNVLRESLANTVAGAAIGCVLAIAAGRLIESLLVGISSTDPLTLSIVVATLLVVSLLASVAPARRAARLDPIEALRAE